MGTAVTPSCRKHHGYRTRDQPPARQARRYGFGGIARCRGNAFRRLAPIKKPAAANAAGFDHGRFHAFREGCGAGVHLFMLRVEVRLVLPAIALYSITRFCRKRLLGET
jgi:hypothetical protein